MRAKSLLVRVPNTYITFNVREVTICTKYYINAPYLVRSNATWDPATESIHVFHTRFKDVRCS